MEFTELMMMETDYFTSASLDWLQEEVEADYGNYWDSLLPVVSSSAGSIQQLCSSSSSEFAGTLTNPSPSYNSVTNLSGDRIVVTGNTEKPVRRRSRASSKRIPATQVHYINATAKNFKDLVQKHTGRPAVPPPFTMFGGGSNYPIKGPVTFSFGTGDAYYEQ